MRVDFDENVLKRRELQVIIGDIARSLHDGVINRASHVAWVEQNKLQPQIDAGIEAHRIGAKEEAHKNFLKQLHAHKDRAVVADGFRMGVQMAVAAREEHDMQKAIQASLTVCSPTLARAPTTRRLALRDAVPSTRDAPARAGCRRASPPRCTCTPPGTRAATGTPAPS